MPSCHLEPKLHPSKVLYAPSSTSKLRYLMGEELNLILEPRVAVQKAAKPGPNTGLRLEGRGQYKVEQEEMQLIVYWMKWPTRVAMKRTF
jgi:hypothetical protein